MRCHEMYLVKLIWLLPFFVFLFTETTAQSWETLNKQGEESYYNNEFEKALKIFSKALPQAEKEFGKNHGSYATACDNLAFINSVLGQYDVAEPLFQESKSIRERVLGKEHPDYAITCINLADLYHATSSFSKAESLYQEAREIFKKVLGDSSNEFALATNNLGSLYVTMGNYDGAKSMYSKAREIWSKIQGKDSPDYATSCNNLGGVYQQIGDYEGAKILYKEAIEIQERLTGKNDLGYATTSNNLGDVYREEENYTKAEPFYVEAMEIRKEILGESHVLFAQSSMNVGLLYQDMGQYAKAERLMLQGRSAYVNVLGKNSPEYGTACNLLAVLYRHFGSYKKAEELYLESLEVFARVLGKNHSDYAQACNDMAGFYRSIKEYRKSESLYLEAKNIRAKIYGTEHPSYLATCNNLAVLYFDEKEYTKAEPLILECFEVIKKRHSPDDPFYGRNRGNLAQIYSRQGKVNEAEQLYKEAKSCYEKSLGKKHIDYALVCNNLAMHYVENGKLKEAEPLLKEAKEIQLAQIRLNFQSLSEIEQKQYYQAIKFYFDNYIDFLIKYYPQSNSSAADLYDIRLITKGIIFNSGLKTRIKILESGDTTLLHKYETLKSLRNYTAKVYSMSVSDKAKRGIDEKKLEEQTNTLEKELTEQASKYSIKDLAEENPPTWQHVKMKLTKKTAAVEIVRVQNKKDTLYVALLLRADEKIGPEMITLGYGRDLEKGGVNYYRNCIKNQIEDQRSYDLFWKPLSARLKGIKQVYFSADGVYHQINLLTLKNALTKKYLGDEVEILTLSSTRDLTRPAKISKAVKAVLLGYPDYTGEDETPDIGDPGERAFDAWSLTDLKNSTRYFDMNSNSVAVLPGTKKEVNSIAQLLEHTNVPTELFIGKEASEDQIKKLKDPLILHIATHGFFLPSQEGNTSQNIQNPLLRSGLLLAGCEKAIRGMEAHDKEDGILTAYEAMNLFLDETDLVILSACETGLGEIQNGEGVYGLQRAFQQAGARSILISLWKVDDATTQLLMTTFYQDYVKTGNLKQSFIKAQKTVRSSYPHPYYWGAFVMMGSL